MEYLFYDRRDMDVKRFSLKVLICGLTFCAIAFATLAHPSRLGVGLWSTVLMSALVGTPVCVAIRPRAHRRGLAASASAMWLYSAIVFGPFRSLGDATFVSMGVDLWYRHVATENSSTTPGDAISGGMPPNPFIYDEGRNITMQCGHCIVATIIGVTTWWMIEMSRSTKSTACVEADPCD
jgi:hypothetical protein